MRAHIESLFLGIGAIDVFSRDQKGGRSTVGAFDTLFSLFRFLHEKFTSFFREQNSLHFAYHPFDFVVLRVSRKFLYKFDTK